METYNLNCITYAKNTAQYIERESEEPAKITAGQYKELILEQVLGFGIVSLSYALGNSEHLLLKEPVVPGSALERIANVVKSVGRGTMQAFNTENLLGEKSEMTLGARASNYVSSVLRNSLTNLVIYMLPEEEREDYRRELDEMSYDEEQRAFHEAISDAKDPARTEVREFYGRNGLERNEIEAFVFAYFVAGLISRVLHHNQEHDGYVVKDRVLTCTKPCFEQTIMNGFHAQAQKLTEHSFEDLIPHESAGKLNESFVEQSKEYLVKTVYEYLEAGMQVRFLDSVVISSVNGMIQMEHDYKDPFEVQ